jgi:hypothetical protein
MTHALHASPDLARACISVLSTNFPRHDHCISYTMKSCSYSNPYAFQRNAAAFQLRDPPAFEDSLHRHLATAATIQTAYHSPSDRRAAAGLSLGLIDVACHPAFSRASFRQWLLLRNAHPTIRSQHTNVPDISHLTHYLLVHPEARFLLRNIPCPRRNDRAGLPQSRRIRMNIALLIGEQAFAYIPLVHFVVSKNAEQNFLEGLKRAE